MHIRLSDRCDMHLETVHVDLITLKGLHPLPSASENNIEYATSKRYNDNAKFGSPGAVSINAETPGDVRKENG